MTSSSPSSRGKGKVVRITRNVDPSGWISDEEIREMFLIWKRIKTVVPHGYLELDLFRKNRVFTSKSGLKLKVLKDHMIEGGINQARTLPYGVLISKILVLQGVDVNGEKKLLCDKSNEINRITLTSIGLVKNMNGWCFKDEENMAASSGSSPVLNEDQTSFIPGTNFERLVVEQFRKTSERILKLEKKVDMLYQKVIKNDLKMEDFDDE
ncbi:hypothetical protein LR48_Vigan10g132800 [Vigna angularis]|uniref:Uncharacterized protein n=1 Tax=Phaseolus angularis TaxID=3914 RepID=A0A0L9VK61_PHAAN|nr:hypothetical protein LR48_Vigan10g132800 [Vigna angularis]